MLVLIWEIHRQGDGQAATRAWRPGIGSCVRSLLSGVCCRRGESLCTRALQCALLTLLLQDITTPIFSWDKQASILPSTPTDASPPRLGETASWSEKSYVASKVAAATTGAVRPLL